MYPARGGDAAIERFVRTMRSRSHAPRTFSLIELRLDEKNEGDGTLAVGVEMKYDKEKNTLVLENFSSEPVRLTRVRKTN